MNTEYTRYRVGMTTDLVERKKYWKREYSDINGLGLMIEESWLVLPHEYHDREKAQAAETALKGFFCADGHHGGANPKEDTPWLRRPWRVYVFKYSYKPSALLKLGANFLAPDIFSTYFAQLQTQAMVEEAQREAFANSAASLANRRVGWGGVPANSAANLAK